MEDEYKDLSDLMDEAKLRKHSVSINELHGEMINLTKLLNDMFSMFKASAEQMNLEEKSGEDLHQSIINKLDELSDENKTIAESLVALAERIKKMEQSPKQIIAQAPSPPPTMAQISMPKPSFPSMPPPPQYSPIQYGMPPPRGPMPPPPGFRGFMGSEQSSMPKPQPFGSDMPLPPDLPDFDEPFPFEEKKERKGLFGRFNKNK